MSGSVEAGIQQVLAAVGVTGFVHAAASTMARVGLERINATLRSPGLERTAVAGDCADIGQAIMAGAFPFPPWVGAKSGSLPPDVVNEAGVVDASPARHLRPLAGRWGSGRRILPSMERFRRRARRLVLAGLLPAVVLTLGVWTWWAVGSGFGPFPGPTTQVVDRSDQRFDVLVQRRPERLGSAGGRLGPPEGRPRLTAARAFAIAGGERQPNGDKPSVRLATFADPDFPTPVGPGHRLVPRPLRALVWVVVVPDVPVVEYGPGGGPAFGPDFGPDRGPDAGHGGQTAACPTRTPVDALTGQPLGIWQEC